MEVAKIEKKILKFWQTNKIFEKSISQRKGKPLFSFYDGPPFATGKPHYGHILATTIKDTVLRYWTMKGYQVPRRVGWDCHGLPVENLIEKELGIKNKREIEAYGIEKFNQACRASVFRCVRDFEQVLKRVGRWADYKDAYATLDNNYIESVWWVFNQLWRQGLVYQDYRVSPYCPRCGTTLSNFEVNQGYKETEDPSIFLKFKIQPSVGSFEKKLGLDKTPSYFLVWTTTPWTLPGNVALAVKPKAVYLLVNQNNENYILAEKRKEILGKDYQIVKKFLGRDLVGLKYEPLFDALAKQKIENIKNAFQVLPADFVSLEEGTGLVHIAVMYGEEDFQLGKKFKLPFYHTVDHYGLFKSEVSEFEGLFVKEADLKIIENLLSRDLLYKKEKIRHSYPFCWRCDTPLLYYAITSWYIAVTRFKKELILNNKKIHWVPGYIKEGRFGNWLREARDWNFSRNRFWGAPIPIWQCLNCKEYKCIGSRKELGKKIKDLHRPYIDKITLECQKCGGLMKRVPEVFDCWFESGSMPYAQWHYPFENKKLVEKTFPADFIAEGLDQTRGWFYTLHILATALTLKNRGLGKSQPAFLNVIVNGLILDEQGRKLSKKLGNYPEPAEIFNRYGADALRYFLLTSTPIGEDYRFSSKGVEKIWQKFILTILHSHNFFQTYTSKKIILKKNFQPKKLLNKWILSRLSLVNQKLISYMDQYELTKGARLLEPFVEDLSNWYIRRARPYFQKAENKKEEEFEQTLYYVLVHLSKLMAPFCPFIAEELYQQLLTKSKNTFPISVHLADYPRPNKKFINKKLEEKMEKVREIVSQALAKRNEAGLKVRQPLNELRIKDGELRKEKELLELIKQEVNVKKITFGKTLKLDTKITPELREEGVVREVIRNIQELRKKAGLRPKDKILVRYVGELSLNEILKRNEKMILREGKIKDLQLAGKEKQVFDIEKTIKVNEKTLWLGIKKI